MAAQESHSSSEDMGREKREILAISHFLWPCLLQKNEKWPFSSTFSSIFFYFFTSLPSLPVSYRIRENEAGVLCERNVKRIHLFSIPHHITTIIIQTWHKNIEPKYLATCEVSFSPLEKSHILRWTYYSPERKSKKNNLILLLIYETIFFLDDVC